jgi:hypothetical protein
MLVTIGEIAIPEMIDDVLIFDYAVPTSYHELVHLFDAGKIPD